ncbi:MAG TPA: DMT family transporter [Sulfuricella sp.]|nr:DMT family transporter [Sulfuricella sp.]
MANTSQSISIDRSAALGVVFAFLAAVGFSAKAILVKLAYLDAVDAITLLALRMAFSAPFFLMAALWATGNKQAAPLEKRDWLAILGLGLIGYYLSSFLDFLGLQSISAGLERLILFLYPTMVVILSALISRRAIGRREIIALALSYAGIALVFMHDVGVNRGGIALGAMLIFASTLSYSVYLVGAGHAIARIGATRFTAYAMIVASTASLIQFGVTHPLAALHLPPRVYGLGIAMAVFSTVLPVFLLSAGIRRIGSGHTSLIGSIGPVATIYLAHVFLGEAVSLPQIAGSSLVLAGVLTISINNRGAGRNSGTKPYTPAASPR